MSEVGLQWTLQCPELGCESLPGSGWSLVNNLAVTALQLESANRAEEAVGDPIAVLPVLFHLLWSHELVTDLRDATQLATNHQFDPRFHPPEALMGFRFIRPGNMAQAIASQFQPVASELIPALRETTPVERGGSRTGEPS